MSDIFVSYRPEDLDRAMDIANRLRKAGYDVLLAEQRRAAVGAHQSVPSDLAGSKCVLVLWSCFSVHSDLIWHEAKYAWDRKILVAACLDASPVPFPFEAMPTANLTEWPRDLEMHEWDFLLGAIATATGKEPHSVPYDFDDETFTDFPLPRMIEIPPGRFKMGSPEWEEGHTDYESPLHEVTIAKSFLMGVTPVTFEEFDAFCFALDRPLPNDEGWGRGRRPAINVSWNDAQAYCNWLSGRTGRRYRLPSEAEWEYCCRAGSETPFHFGASISTELANYNGNMTYGRGRRGIFRKKTTLVASFPPNAFGLHDMHGNVWEWCQDRWHANYRGMPVDGSAWVQGRVEARVVRGGSWINDPSFLRSAYRFGNLPHLRYDLRGFRVARYI